MQYKTLETLINQHIRLKYAKEMRVICFLHRLVLCAAGTPYYI